jgi:hypothetical protein
MLCTEVLHGNDPIKLPQTAFAESGPGLIAAPKRIQGDRRRTSRSSYPKGMPLRPSAASASAPGWLDRSERTKLDNNSDSDCLVL